MFSKLALRRRRDDDDDRPAPPARRAQGGAAVATGGRKDAHPLVAALADGGLAPWRVRFDDFLPQNEELADRRHSPFATLTIYVICAFVVATVIWMLVSSLDRVALAQGVIRPSGKVKLVNHTEGGRVVRLLVRDGSEVREGDVMLELESELVEQEVAKNRTAWLALSAEVARLEGETENRTPSFTSDVMASADLFTNAMGLWRARQDEIGSRRAAADAQIAQAGIQLAGLRQQFDALTQQLPLLERRARDLNQLADQGFYSKIQALEAQRQWIDAQGRHGQVSQQLKQIEQQLTEATERRAIIDREWNSTNLKRLTDARSERDRAQAALTQQTQIRRNLSVRAPIDGVVIGLKVTGAGQVVRSGEPILGVVLASDVRKVELEARVSNNDIGQISVGQRVVVKLSTYDWIKHGAVEGTVTLISADATTGGDPTSGGSAPNPAAPALQPYFIVIVSLDRDYVGEDAKRNRIAPGMTATAEFHVGEGTIMGYFTDRLFRGAGESLRER